MPLASALAAMFGALLLFWRRVTLSVRSGFAAVRRKVHGLFSAPP
jgi:hypothetical protein